ncbi:pollen receptor-like kinase 4 [Cynara cardunculus var. scolymus]|uniref:non-specific serine/threonine protein kinase n=1 Tax=Cynara cardunculus var. scolymus TaxID=59895 RepID=A0A103XIS8_CYNCS|nr:pollen receptor-like kinase 4 [Cynara cardunculus var. scolymus]KVH91561.1 Leucine-rich repeat-containing N-terminal, type 2 [Cynara cardunculus var. scolymus]
MACSRPPYWLTLLLIHVLLTCSLVLSDEEDGKKLLKFKNSLLNTEGLSNWNITSAPCNSKPQNWTGVICNDDGSVFGLQLENMGLGGNIDMDTLAEVTSIRTLSFMNNNFEGTMPNVQKIGPLRGVFLSYNKFSGDISGDAFSGMSGLRKVELANNDFTGKIPISLTQLPLLVDLQLQNNKFEGEIPDFDQKDLKVNFANNRLEGSVPQGLGNQDPSSFAGNNVCGKPLGSCKIKKRNTLKIIIIAIVSLVAVLAAIVIAMFLFRAQKRGKNEYRNQIKKTDRNNTYKANPNEIQMHNQKEIYKRTDNGGKLHFVRTDRERFELEDLLRASADVLGSGSFGSSYKAMILDGPAMVVKRFKEMSNVRKEDFHAHMRLLGSLSHPNLLPLVAFYYKKDEKLLITDFAVNGSLASHLHVKRKPDEPGLDWATRLKIIKGVARGLDYLYQELPRLSLPHGHLKSSNVLLDDAYNPLLADYALVPLINKEHAQQLMVAYKSPEFTQHGRTTKKTDVWCFGILILEMLTGKFPANYLEQGKGGKPDLGTWVNSVVREEWTGEVFDKEMKGTKNGEGEMLKLLKIGMCCCEWDITRRWDLKEVMEKIEELKEREEDEEYSSYASEGDANSSRAMDDDNFSFSVTS